MLTLPTVGMSQSVNNVHNINFLALCDWIEGSVLFDDEEVSSPDVIDVLIESEVYKDQDFAWEIVTNAWRELERRQGWLENGYPIKVNGRKLERLHLWQNVPAHSFCIALAYAKWYPTWASGFGQDYNEQGELFESLTKESLEKLFPDWEIYPTGWTRTHPSKIKEVVEEITARLGEIKGEIEIWTDSRAHEKGLDLLCYRPFGDGRVGVPVFLMQCASGKRWEEKRKTPDLRIWTKIITFASDPKRAFAMPFALSDKEFRQNCNLVNGMFLDRYRLLLPCRTDPDWVSAELKTSLVSWLEPRIEKLPRYNE